MHHRNCRLLEFSWSPSPTLLDELSGGAPLAWFTSIIGLIDAKCLQQSQQFLASNWYCCLQQFLVQYEVWVIINVSNNTKHVANPTHQQGNLHVHYGLCVSCVLYMRYVSIIIKQCHSTTLIRRVEVREHANLRPLTSQASLTSEWQPSFPDWLSSLLWLRSSC